VTIRRGRRGLFLPAAVFTHRTKIACRARPRRPRRGSSPAVPPGEPARDDSKSPVACRPRPAQKPLVSPSPRRRSPNAFANGGPAREAAELVLPPNHRNHGALLCPAEPRRARQAHELPARAIQPRTWEMINDESPPASFPASVPRRDPPVSGFSPLRGPRRLRPRRRKQKDEGGGLSSRDPSPAPGRLP